ncbi:hypothetical protein Pmani_014628 [Petrolisthes manimaculis]|uniref:Y+L amino acid transporter 2 n=1 Tax=Petrolisthes manimaculis TaxID=1843537 RepID=A0AAE1PTY9_9EUCA|nr:hypothetical protein Pmani_014628 [Petrolisthes manimaculis]
MPTKSREVYPTAPSELEPLLVTACEKLVHRVSDNGGCEWVRKNEEKQEKKKEDDDDGNVRLKKELGLMDGVGIVVGIIIGSGIFVSPKGVLQYSGSVGVALLVWAMSGAISMVGALCYAELGTMIPRSGGDYVYILEAFGEIPAFLFLWVSLVVTLPVSNTVVSLTFANYIIKPAFATCNVLPDVPVRLIAALVVCFLTWLNCTNVKWTKKVQGVFTMGKVCALILIIGAGIYHLASGHTELYQDPFQDSKTSITSLSAAFCQGLFSFGGWNCLNFVVEELKNPYRNLPLSILISMPIVTLVYFFVNVAYFAVLEPSEVFASEAVAISFASRALGVVMYAMPACVALSTFGTLNGLLFSCSRLFFVGAREGHLPQSLALISTKHYTPVPALVFQCVMTLLMLSSSDTMALINCVSFSISLFVLFSITSLLWLRYTQPDRKRPIKIWLWVVVLFFFVSLFLVVFPVIERPVELGLNLAVLVAGVPVYYIFVRAAPRSKRFNSFMGSITYVCQLLCLGLPEEKQE